MAKTRRASRKSSRKAERKGSRKASRKTSRKTQSGGKRPLSQWNKDVKRVYAEMKRKDSSTTFGKALEEASKRKKAGNL